MKTQTSKRWILADDIYSLPGGPGVYAIYLKDELQYIGSAVNLNSRLFVHQHTFGKVYVLLRDNLPDVRVKYRKSVRYGDWAMIELRLIERLQPSLNHRGIRRACDRPMKRRWRMETSRA